MAIITSVWSAYGHQFHPTGTPGYERCVICGAEYALSIEPDCVDCGYEYHRGFYHTWGGAEPGECADRNDLEHGYEAVCQMENGRSCDSYRETGTCEHLAADQGCNCLLCTG